MLTEMYYFDRRLVHPLLSWNGIAEVGMASLAVGVPLFALGILRRRQMLERQARFSMRCRLSCS